MFNLNTLEQDIERLSQEVKEKKSLPENKDLPDKEVVRQVIQTSVKPDSQTQITVPLSDSSEQSVLPDYLKNATPEFKLKVEELVDEVFHKSLEKAIEDAQNSGPFVLDAFHDALTDKLYDELVERKLI